MFGLKLLAEPGCPLFDLAFDEIDKAVITALLSGVDGEMEAHGMRLLGVMEGLEKETDKKRRVEEGLELLSHLCMQKHGDRQGSQLAGAIGVCMVAIDTWRQ